MADVLRRQKDQIKKTLSSYLNSTTNSEYLKYFEGSPTYIIYYRQNNNASEKDTGLETVNSFIGTDSPKKYDKISDVQVWGVDALDVSNELMERGLSTSVSGEILFLPNTVIPYAGDYFVFDYEGLERHLFRINDVQFDKLTSQKYYRCSYSLTVMTTDEIEKNINGEYEVQSGNNNLQQTNGDNIVPVGESLKIEETKKLVDAIIDRYTKLFYNDDMDTFIYQSRDGNSYWCPYLQHFVHDHKVLNRYYQDILTEIYVMDINEVDNPNVYNEEVYRRSIFRNIEIQNNELDFDSNFLTLNKYDLKLTRNLPFFMSPNTYMIVSPIDKTQTCAAYIDAFPLLFGKQEPFKDVDHYHKVHIMDSIHIARLEEHLKPGDLVYECRNHELQPTKITRVFEVEEGKEKYLELQDVSVEKLIKPKEDISFLENSELFRIIRDYLNGNFSITMDVMEQLNKHYYKNSLETYILVPIVLYIIKDSIGK